MEAIERARFFLGEDVSENDTESIKQWAFTTPMFHHAVSKNDWNPVYETYKQMKKRLHQEFLYLTAWFNDNVCRSDINFNRFQVIRMQKILDLRETPQSEEETDPQHKNLSDWFYAFYSDAEFSAFCSEVESELRSYGEEAHNADQVQVNEDIAYIYFLRFRIDEIASSIIRIILSTQYSYDQKTALIIKESFLHEIYNRALNQFCADWESLREGRPGMEFVIGFFHGNFRWYGAMIDRCRCKSNIEQYYKLLLNVFVYRKTKDKALIDLQQITGLLSFAKETLNKEKDEAEKYEADQNITIDSYLPLTEEELDTLLSGTNDEGEQNFILSYNRIHGLLSCCNCALNFLSVFGDDFDSDLSDTLFDELDTLRKQICSIVFADSSRKANRFFSSLDIDHISEKEKHIETCSKYLNILEQCVFSANVTRIDRFMEAQKSLKSLISEEDPPFIRKWAKYVMGIMANSIEEYEKNNPENLMNVTKKQICDTGIQASLIPEMVTTQLSGGEMLYAAFIKDASENPAFDYSCIAIMYYKALESLLTKYLYVDYLKKNDLLEHDNNGDHTRYKSEDEAKALNKKYFSDCVSLQKGTRRQEGKFKIPDYCELGTLAYIFCSRSLKDDETASKALQDYLRAVLHISDFDLLIDYCKRVADLAKKRNDVAHGLHFVSFNDAVNARTATYINEIESINGLIIEFLKLIGTDDSSSIAPGPGPSA